MPYKTSHPKYKKGKYHPWIKAVSPAVGLVAKAAAVQTVKYMMNVETKWFDLAAAPAAIPNTLNYLHQPSLGLAQGDTANSRDGASIRVKSIMTNIYLNASTCTQSESSVRLICIYQPMVNGNPFTTGGALLATASSPQALISPYSMNSNGYSVVYDKVHKLGSAYINTNTSATATQSHAPQTKVIKHVYKPKSKMHIQWGSNDTTGANNSLLDKGFYAWFAYSTNNDNTSDIQFFSRVKYVDN